MGFSPGTFEAQSVAFLQVLRQSVSTSSLENRIRRLDLPDIEWTVVHSKSRYRWPRELGIRKDG